MTKRTKALNPSAKVKQQIWERDEKCVVSGSYDGLTVAHYIGKGQGGLGIPQNLVLLSMEVHYKYDNGTKADRERIGNKIKEYLQSVYPGWNEAVLYYKKEW